MENYTEWNNNKMYEGHIRRLTEIKEKQKKVIKVTKNFRVKSEPSKSQTNIKKQFLPLPLVPKSQRLLLGSVVKQKTMTLREKQSLLENYLLSKRILQTNSVFDSKLLKKQFNFHRKVSDNMTRNLRINRKNFSQLRGKSKFITKVEYSQLQKLKQENYYGSGKVNFKLKINEIMLIKRKIQENNESRFNLTYKPEKFKSYQIKAMTFTELITKWHYFRATKKQAEKKNGLKFQIQEVRGNESHKLGEFRLHLDLQFEASQNSLKNQSQIFNPQNYSKTQYQLETERRQPQKRKVIEKLLHPITKFLIGTIEFTFKSQGIYEKQQDD